MGGPSGVEGLLMEAAVLPSSVPPDLQLEGHGLPRFLQVLHTHPHRDSYLEEGKSKVATPVSLLGPVPLLQSHHYYHPPSFPQGPIHPGVEFPHGVLTRVSFFMGLPSSQRATLDSFSFF